MSAVAVVVCRCDACRSSACTGWVVSANLALHMFLMPTMYCMCLAVCLQLLARSKQVGPLQPLTVRMEATHVKLRGRLRLALVLGQEPPGIM